MSIFIALVLGLGFWFQALVALGCAFALVEAFKSIACANDGTFDPMYKDKLCINV